SARNLDTIQRMVHTVFSVWKGLRRKRSSVLICPEPIRRNGLRFAIIRPYGKLIPYHPSV
ncbi:MAG: hypothetical protein K2O49_06505, partial [Muribaculaceae bacterium]|nr:hypothetical protein [Muribaculaceae bacterium]